MRQILTKQSLAVKVTIALIVMFVAIIICLFTGPQPISLKALLAGPADAAGANPDYEILIHFRLPRILLAVIVGAALSCAGVTLQAILRNPLAEPYILGISSGAGLGVVIAIISGLTWSVYGHSAVAVCAFAGALGTAWLVWAIGRCAAKSQMTSLILAGVVVNAFFSAVIMFLISIAKSQKVHSTIFWLMGNITEETYFTLWLAATCVAIGFLVLFRICPQLNALSFGETDAQAIGVNTARVRIIALGITAFITAVAVSLSGLIGFVGLIVPHGVRLVFGPDHRQLLPLSAIIGGIFLVIADTFARTIVAPAQLPVGVVTAITGAPFFLILLIRYTKKLSWLSK